MITAFRIIAFLEGVSYILLLFIAVPIKYMLQDESYVKLLGMPHGLLFVAYIALAFVVRTEQKWSSFVFTKILVAALIPFATFYVDMKYLKPLTK
jgi:integral membrane protein